MNSKMSIDEIREAVSILEHDAEAFYRYNDPKESLKLFNRITIRDKKRLLYWAIKDENKDIRNVANYLIQKLNLVPNDHEKFPLQMSQEDFYEIAEVRKQIYKSNRKKKTPTIFEQEQLVNVLSEACKRIGFLTIEKAYWVLLDHNLKEEPKWIECKVDMSEQSSFQVPYYPNKEERVRLLELMREASWVIHLHNHPLLLLESENLDFSLEDRNFAKHWESLRPELANKMLWGVVQRNYIHGMPFTLPSHMTLEVQIKPEIPEKSKISNNVSEPKQEEHIIDAHANYENMTKKQKGILKKYIEDLKQGKDVVYKRQTKEEEKREYIIHSIIAIVGGAVVIAILIYLIIKIIEWFQYI